jgi:pilus assembly protein FimV
MARKKRLAVALAALGCLQAGSVWALGLGELSLNSFLNEPLRAEVGLLDVGNLDQDQIRVRLATADDFDRLGIDRAYFLTGISFEVQVDKNGRGKIILTSEDPVLEPYLDFIVEARWPSGRLLRNYTVLVDPPAFESQGTTVSASRRVAEVEGTPAPAATEVEVVSEGTRVGMRESSLAPGAMPERNFSAGTSAEPAPGARYMIRRDETLWTIAQRARPEGISVQQAMLEIQRLNPDAFIDGNINRIKAGYIIYLPDSGDVNAAETDLAAVLAEVRQQNEDWRAGRASAPASAGPALRISAGAAEDDTTADSADGDTSVADSETVNEANSGTAESATVSAVESQPDQGERDAFAEQLTRLTERLDALERMVEVKDAEIASLQQALAAAEAAPASAAATAPAAVTPPPAPVPVAAEPQPVVPQSSGGLGVWPYVAGGGLLAALLGVLLWRRRQNADTSDEPAALVPVARPRQKEADAFDDIQLQDHAVEFDDESSDAEATAAPSAAPEDDTTLQRGGQRGYGERKHDEYASDVDAGDALAEADIYIAYGRYSQAMELLRKATRSDPDNASYHLKLLDLAAEMGDRDEADQQMIELQRIGDADSIARAEQLLADARLSGAGERAGEPADFSSASDLSGDLDDSGFLSDFNDEPAPRAAAKPAEDLSAELPELDELGSLDARDALVPSVDEEPEFLDLEIEDGSVEDLDLSADFEKGRSGGDSSEDDFVFADDGDPMSTKLDLARAYIDMGDDDGARQILDEVMSGGSTDQQQEARELLERLG